jgi:hypothetical protein
MNVATYGSIISAQQLANIYLFDLIKPMFAPTVFKNIAKSSRFVFRGVATSLKTTSYKSTTGLVGIAVDLDARNTLMDLTTQCLNSVQVCRNK